MENPYVLAGPPVRKHLLHHGRRVRAATYGPVGAPYPDRHVLIRDGAEGGWEKDGAFFADPEFPRKCHVRVATGGKNEAWRVPGFAVGPPGAAFPACSVFLIRWDAIDVGYVPADQPGANISPAAEETAKEEDAKEFVCVHSLPCVPPFAGIEPSDLKGGGTDWSAAVLHALRAAREAQKAAQEDDAPAHVPVACSLHRDDDLPSVVDVHGYHYWYCGGLLHRADGRPAVEHVDGYQAWYKYGLLHRADGRPAVVYPSGALEWWVDGTLLRYQEPLVARGDGST